MATTVVTLFMRKLVGCKIEFMQQFKLFCISWIWIGPWGLLENTLEMCFRSAERWIYFWPYIIFSFFVLFVFFLFFLCHIFEYFNNFVLKHWLFAFIFQNSYLSTWGSCRLGSASIVFFFANFLWSTLQQNHFVCMNLSYFLCLPPLIYNVFVEKTRWLF